MSEGRRRVVIVNGSGPSTETVVPADDTQRALLDVLNGIVQRDPHARPIVVDPDLTIQDGLELIGADGGPAGRRRNRQHDAVSRARRVLDEHEESVASGRRFGKLGEHVVRRTVMSTINALLDAICELADGIQLPTSSLPPISRDPASQDTLTIPLPGGWQVEIEGGRAVGVGRRGDRPRTHSSGDVDFQVGLADMAAEIHETVTAGPRPVEGDGSFETDFRVVVEGLEGDAPPSRYPRELAQELLTIGSIMATAVRIDADIRTHPGNVFTRAFMQQHVKRLRGALSLEDGRGRLLERYAGYANPSGAIERIAECHRRVVTFLRAFEVATAMGKRTSKEEEASLRNASRSLAEMYHSELEVTPDGMYASYRRGVERVIRDLAYRGIVNGDPKDPTRRHPFVLKDW